MYVFVCLDTVKVTVCLAACITSIMACTVYSTVYPCEGYKRLIQTIQVHHKYIHRIYSYKMISDYGYGLGLAHLSIKHNICL